MVKPIYYALVVCLLTVALKIQVLNFRALRQELRAGYSLLKQKDSAIYGENIKDGKFSVDKKQLKYPDYYLFNITDSDHPDDHPPFEIYLEGGRYTIETEAGKLFKYPKIITDSKIQNDLSDYYILSDKLMSIAKENARKLNEEVSKKSSSLSNSAYTALLNQLSTTENKMGDIGLSIFKQFVKEHPNSIVTAHIMSGLNYEDDPVAYNAIYQMMPANAKNTDEGKEIGNQLSHLVKLVTGAKAPSISGKTPDGKPFDESSIRKKLILIDFWRAGNDYSRQNHQKLAALLNSIPSKDDFGIVSVSLDTKPDWWTTAIAGDNLTWPQVSDLKGDDSPNAANWCITTIPTYYLLDGNWKIVERNIQIGTVNFEVSDYLKKHR